MIEPMTATPSAPPTWRVTSLIADPTPALASGTALMTLSVAGAIATPIESASPNVTSPSSIGRHLRRPGEARAQDDADTDQAAGDDLGPADASARWLDAPEPMTRPSASGSIAAPASSALKPCANCRYCVKAKTEPIIAKKTSPTPTDATVKLGLAKKLSGSIGATHLRSQATKAAPRTAAAREAPEDERVRPALRGRLDDPEDERDQHRDRQAGAGEIERPGPRVAALGDEANPATSAMPTIGTFSQNTELHENHSRRSPPTNGPRPMPTPATADQMPIALPRSSRGKTSMITDNVAGMIIAPPMPITARSAIS